MDNRLLLLQTLRLENYKLHADTEVDLSDRPILLITGANGSGKTQVLEALRLCLGVRPTPSRGHGMVSSIGPCGREARVSLDVRNPVLDGHRLLRPPHEELARAVDHAVVRVSARVRPSGTVEYRVGPAEPAARGTRVSTRQVLDLFRSTNVQAANRLAFTEEGVVDVFASESGRKKLESLLEATGRLQYLDDLRQALVHLDDAVRQAAPLRQKLQWDREFVESMRERLEIVRNRTKYLEQHAALVLEHAWAQVRDGELSRDKMAARTQRAEARLERCRVSLRDAEDLLRRTQDDIAEATRQTSERAEAITRERSALQRTVGQRLHLQQGLSEASDQLGRLRAEVDDLTQTLAAEEGEDKTALFRQRQRELIRTEHEIRGVLNEIEAIAAQVEAAVGDIDLEAVEAPSTPGMTRLELAMIDAATLFQRAVAERGLDQQIIGPVIALVTIRTGEEPWERAVRCLAGRNLFAFVARDRETYAAAKQLYDELFPHRKPPITVARHTEHQPKAPHGPLPSGVHARALGLIEGEAFCLAFLRRVVRGAVAESGGDANALTDFAQAIGAPVLTRDCRSYYAPFGGFTRPPAPLVTPLGTPLDAQAGASAPNRPYAVRKLEARQRELLRRHSQLARRAREQQGELHSMGVRPQVVERLRTVEERAEALDARLREMIAEDARLLKRIQTLNATVNELLAAEEPLATDLDELQARARGAEAEAVRATTLIAEEEKVIERFRTEMAAIAEQLRALEGEAVPLGPRPPEVRDTALVAQEMNEVKGKLDAIVGQHVDEDNLRRKEQELADLEDYIDERNAHIDRLQRDLAERREVWQREVKAMIQQLSRVMRTLLRGRAFRDVRLEATHVESPERAELAIRAQTKGTRWLDYRELSGGEKVLCTEALIMALHTMTDSPVHAIDEFTQRLDKSNAAAAFDIVRKAFEMTASGQSLLLPQFILLCPEAFGLEDNVLISHIVLLEAKLRARRPRAPGADGRPGPDEPVGHRP